MKKLLGFLLILAAPIILFAPRVYAIGYANTAAELVVGQSGFNCQTAENGGDNRRGLDASYSSVLVANGKLFIPGGNLYEIQVFNTIPTTNNALPDYILGRFDPCITARTSELPNNYKLPLNVFYDGTHFFVADQSNNRVLIYNGIPSSQSVAPDLVIGQPDFATYTRPTGGSVGANTLAGPYDMWSDGTKLIVSDMVDSRILIWNTFPTTNGQPADVVIGQTDMNGSASGITAVKLNNPRGIDVYGGKLYVADYMNNRVLIFNSIPTSNGASADVVIGQPDMNTKTANTGGLNANTLSAPTDVFVSNGKMFIGDRTNNRILIFNSLPTSNRPNADVVVGQDNMTTATSGISATKLNTPYSGYTDGTKLYVMDYNNNRVLIYNSIPTSNGAAADVVLGQPDMTSNAKSQVKSVTAATNGWTQSVRYNGTGLFAVDYGNNRVLKYNTLPTVNGTAADIAIGQPDLVTGSSGVTASKFQYPTDVLTVGQKLLVGMTGRVLIFNTIPTSSGASANTVVGQPDFTHGTANNGGISAKSMYYPQGLASNGTNLIVSDVLNHRIQVFNTIPTTDFAPADVVIGQPDKTSNTANNGGVSATSLNRPFDACISGSKLAIADSANNRVLIFNSIPTSDGAAADVVLGQPDMVSSTANNGGISARSLNGPQGVACVDQKLFISDSTNARILIYNSIPTSSFAAADAVIGQPDMVSNHHGSSNRGLSDVVGIDVSDTKLFVADFTSSRVLIYPKGPQHTSVTGGGLFNPANVTISLAADDAKEVMISEDPSFTGASWSSFATTKSVTVSAGSGVKTLYVKMRDYVNYESSTYTTTVTIDAEKPNVVKITDIGKISNVPDKSPLYYYFTSQTAKIKGTAEAGSTVHFKYGSSDKTTLVGTDGKFSIELSNLPRGLIEFTYYTQDPAGNKSTSRILKLMIGEENFPAYLVSSTTAPTVTPTPTVTTIPTNSPTQTPTPTLVLYDVQLTDQTGKVLKNTTVYINGQKYQTDGSGKLYVQESVAKSAGVTVEVNGKKYQGNILGNTIVAQVTQPTTKKANYSWVWLSIIFFVVIIAWFIARRKR